MTRTVEGSVAPFGVLSTDGRRLAPGSLWAFLAGGTEEVNLDDGPVEVSMPLMGLRAPGDGHLGAEVVGRLTRVWVGEDDWIRVEGTVMDAVEPGKYGCGVDVSLADATIAWLDEPDEEVTEEALLDDTQRVLVHTFRRGRLTAVTIYLDGATATPAFEGAEVTVQ